MSFIDGSETNEANINPKDQEMEEAEIEEEKNEEDREILIEYTSLEEARGHMFDKKAPWDQQMTMLFIDLYKERMDEFKDPRLRLKRDLYEEIAAEMVKSGFETTGNECNRKMRNLKNYFLNIHTLAEAEGENDIKWPYYESLLPIFKEAAKRLAPKKMMYLPEDEAFADSVQIGNEDKIRLDGETVGGLKATRRMIEAANIKEQRINETLEKMLMAGLGIDGNTEGVEWWLDLAEDQFFRLFRMSNNAFIALQAEINYFENIANEERDKFLLATLWFLTSADDIGDISDIFGFDLEPLLKDQLERILLLSNVYLQWPKEAEANMIEEKFAFLYNFPGVVGVLGCAYIEVCVDNLEQRDNYYNEQCGKHVIVLQAVCDCNFLLRHISVGFPGNLSISTVFKNSPLSTLLTKPNNYLLAGNKHIIGGTEHPQMRTLLTPYKHGILTDEQMKFNDLHGEVSSVVECTFTAMGNRFIRLNSVDNFDPELATLVISAICILYNFTVVKHDKCELYMK